jgi:hypothetical protein
MPGGEGYFFAEMGMGESTQRNAGAATGGAITDGQTAFLVQLTSILPEPGTPRRETARFCRNFKQPLRPNRCSGTGLRWLPRHQLP